MKLWKIVHASEQYKFSCGSFFITSSRNVILTLLSKLVIRQESMYNMRCGATLPHSLSNGYAIKPRRILINKEFADCQKLLSSDQAIYAFLDHYIPFWSMVYDRQPWDPVSYNFLCIAKAICYAVLWTLHRAIFWAEISSIWNCQMSLIFSWPTS